MVALPLVHSTAGGGDDEEVAGKRWRGREEAEDRIKTEGGEREGEDRRAVPLPPLPPPTPILSVRPDPHFKGKQRPHHPAQRQ